MEPGRGVRGRKPEEEMETVLPGRRDKNTLPKIPEENMAGDAVAEMRRHIPEETQIKQNKSQF